MNSVTTHHVTIKGTKDGLVFLLNDNCSFEDIMSELEKKLSLSENGFFQGPINHVTVQTGSRTLTEEEEERLRNRVSLHGNLIIQSIRSDAPAVKEEKKDPDQFRILAKTIRSGQIVESDCSVLLLGDLNPGGCLISKGDIYVIGSLRGMAHAGSEGDRDAIIAASVMYPTQLRIADVISRPPEEWDEQEMELEFAYLEEEEMAIEKINQLHKLRPHKERFIGAH